MESEETAKEVVESTEVIKGRPPKKESTMARMSKISAVVIAILTALAGVLHEYAAIKNSIIEQKQNIVDEKKQLESSLEEKSKQTDFIFLRMIEDYNNRLKLVEDRLNKSDAVITDMHIKIIELKYLLRSSRDKSVTKIELPSKEPKVNNSASQDIYECIQTRPSDMSKFKLDLKSFSDLAEKAFYKFPYEQIKAFDPEKNESTDANVVLQNYKEEFKEQEKK